MRKTGGGTIVNIAEAVAFLHRLSPNADVRELCIHQPGHVRQKYAHIGYAQAAATSL